MPEIASRLSLERWQSEGRDETAAASERVREIIAAADALAGTDRSSRAYMDSAFDAAISAVNELT